MKGPIRACWKCSACRRYLARPIIIPSAALLTSTNLPSPLQLHSGLWLTCELQRAVIVIRVRVGPGYPASSQSQLALAERQPLPPSESGGGGGSANKNDKLTVKELHIFHMLSWKRLRFLPGVPPPSSSFLLHFYPSLTPNHIQIYETPHLSRQSKNNPLALWRGLW